MESAIFEDCRKLIDYFVASGDSSFPSFCDQWKILQFHHIYFAQTSYIEVMQTTAAVIHYAKRHFCCNQDDDKTSKDVCTTDSAKNTTAQHFTEEKVRRRIGCLYLLYAIYFKQPTECFMKIEANLETWRTLKTFIDSLPATSDMDAPRYVFWRLLEANAFRFTALNYYVGLDDLVDYDKLNDKENTAFWCKNSGKELGQQLHDFPATQRILPALSVLEDGYNEMKEMLVNSSSSGMQKQSLPSSTIFKSIEQCFESIQAIIDDKEGSVKKIKSMAVESTKRNLKRKGFNNTLDAKKSNDGEEKSNKYKNLRRMSARTVFLDELPADLLEDLEEQESNESSVQQDMIESIEHEVSESNASDVTNANLTESQKEIEQHSEDILDSRQQQEVIEQQINELLEVEIAEEFISIPKDKRNN